MEFQNTFLEKALHYHNSTPEFWPEKSYDISVNVKGGGLSGQAGAIRLGISRALNK